MRYHWEVNSMTCPKCMGTDISPVGTTHYICNNPNCVTNGIRTQFRLVIDDKVRFPYNQIFVTRSKKDFFRKPYITMASLGNSKT